ncbi:DUF4350 domain-containing protein [Chitinophaga sp.]|uniref:DUF4350 domain-containing protein n=1 Tax=Chitinophaga sp. TaxID=1869181 RepID=UPI0026341292|nr:DUF4350 domain-containing protein [uncultured Chitinophaga sp.]
MNKRIIIIGLAVAVVILFILLLMGISHRVVPVLQQGVDPRYVRTAVHYGNKNTTPYGSKAAFSLLDKYFNGRAPRLTTRPFTYTYRKTKSLEGGNSVYIAVASRLFLTEQDAADMSAYVAAGNQLFLVVESTDSLLENTFGFTTTESGWEMFPASAVQRFVNPAFSPDTVFSGKGIPMNRYLVLEESDSAVITILGNNARHQPNFFRVQHGEGQLFVLLNPMTWTNSWLLENDNVQSLTWQMAYLRMHADHVYWDEFYKYQKVRRTSDNFSDMQVMLKHPPLRWALWLALLLVALYIFSESKRRQRIIPAMPVLRNNSIDFAETLGRLYYLHHNNTNLAQKMAQHLLEYIRQHYFLNTAQINAEFISGLARKSGHPREFIEGMMQMVTEVRLGGDVDDEYLHTFYNSIYQFYQKTK